MKNPTKRNFLTFLFAFFAVVVNVLGKIAAARANDDANLALVDCQDPNTSGALIDDSSKDQTIDALCSLSKGATADQISHLKSNGYDVNHVASSVRILSNALSTAGIDPVGTMFVAHGIHLDAPDNRVTMVCNLIQDTLDHSKSVQEFQDTLRSFSENFQNHAHQLFANIFIKHLIIEPNKETGLFCGAYGSNRLEGVSRSDCFVYQGFGAISDAVLAYAYKNDNIILIMRLRKAYLEALELFKSNPAISSDAMQELESRVKIFDTKINQICEYKKSSYKSTDGCKSTDRSVALVSNEPAINALTVKGATLDLSFIDTIHDKVGIGRIPIKPQLQSMTAEERYAYLAVFIRLFDFFADDPFRQSYSGYHNSAGRASDAIVQMADQLGDLELLELLKSATVASSEIMTESTAMGGIRRSNMNLVYRDDYYKRRSNSMLPTYQAAIQRAVANSPAKEEIAEAKSAPKRPAIAY